jgi:hypothetical protein
VPPLVNVGLVLVAFVWLAHVFRLAVRAARPDSIASFEG